MIAKGIIEQTIPKYATAKVKKFLSEIPKVP
jgi:hypothetical protein